jgi:hypothetical protein
LVYNLNTTLEPDKKIHIYPSNVPFDWETMTTSKYERVITELDQRDSVMAELVMTQFETIQNQHSRKKALVIMNYRHAFGPVDFSNGSRGNNMARYVFDRYGDRVANVMINSVKIAPDPQSGKILFSPLQEGKWDAAFAALGNPSLGFDFRGSPFGGDAFDYYTHREHSSTYQDVFKGFVFYEPLQNHRLVMGLPELYTEEMGEAIRRRLRIKGAAESADKMIENVQTRRGGTYHDINGLKVIGIPDSINRWILDQEHSNKGSSPD